MEEKANPPAGEAGGHAQEKGQSGEAFDGAKNKPNGSDSQGFDFAAFDNLGPKPNGSAAPRRWPAAFYVYTDEHGAPLYRKTRIEKGGIDANGKPVKITPFKRWDPQSREWVGGHGCMDGVRRVPYRLPQLLAAVAEGREIIIVEGEKNVRIAQRLGLAATSSDTWPPELTCLFDGVSVAILPDNDSSGAAKAQKAAIALSGIAKHVRIVPLPVTGKGHDIEQWIAGGGTREQLLGLIAQAADFVPPAPEPEQPAQEREPWTPWTEAHVVSAMKCIPADCDREEWLTVLMALHWTGWERARQLAEWWSQSCPERFNPSDFESVWKSFHQDGQDGKAKTLGSLFHLAKDHGNSYVKAYTV